MENQVDRDDPIYGHLTNRERRFVKSLQKRAAWLEQRIGSALNEQTYDNQERAALQWALGVIANARKDDNGIPEGKELV